MYPAQIGFADGSPEGRESKHPGPEGEGGVGGVVGGGSPDECVAACLASVHVLARLRAEELFSSAALCRVGVRLVS